ncbi:di-trans,poly-cis-decaprenylcistransferase [Phytophthora nicotianae CJ01A1]|uniref:Alkyl transferase n=3 Tax=Phytophthora nicotianae TaxID=4792 RepID=W2YNK3_PHYNI|nr:di-trans,poly-cis-decaprenylcistransferase [Phytophthora nicotianae]ETL31480.1 di-trans,poly-cis-decaprenylcistransferase [Phytophthora nicotianae]ETL84733.1 di-trans,poly-cis-decaprenylcistransferase [Phytophthora nicotianae]ETP07733.1 di-trans,poly-cis-decaprenylcistransferase [Phytophthora nicotianae CJ01A1]ETP35749.1 di-trans,poly-cis-decaprenylcistransferase [Phytophthora nicotianae P10297]
MDENASGVIWPRESLGRQTLSQLEDASRDLGLAKSFYNGFEMWWLAGMPITLVFVLTLLSFSLASGVSGLGKSVSWRKMLPASVWYLVGWMNRLLNADFLAMEKKTARTAMLKDAGELKIPRHIAVIMDGNRRYGKTKYGAGVRGHTDGSKTLVNFTDWCIDAGIQALTVFAFSTENWNREQSEVDALMNLFNQFMHEIVPEALKRDVRVRVLVSDGRKLPAYIVEAIEEIETKTQNCSKFSLNLCVSYGARDEIVGACRKIATEVVRGETSVEDINEDLVSQRMLTAGLPDPDILIRTSGELRISNFLLFQIAYSELIFMDKMWPEVTKDDVEGIIMEFNRRKRRFGK